jgi:hypothetical protein
MRPSTLETRNRLAKVRNLARSLALLVIAAGLLSGCETTSSGPGPLAAQAAKPPEPPTPEPPMTRSRAAEECWMKTEKGSAAANLDKRADVVTKCINDKMKAAQAAPKA